MSFWKEKLRVMWLQLMCMQCPNWKRFYAFNYKTSSLFKDIVISLRQILILIENINHLWRCVIAWPIVQSTITWCDNFSYICIMTYLFKRFVSNPSFTLATWPFFSCHSLSHIPTCLAHLLSHIEHWSWQHFKMKFLWRYGRELCNTLELIQTLYA